jgi:hypothetical protein
MTGELVPFGKHKGQPVEVLLADRGYVEWLLAQPWVRDRFPTFHTTIINYGGEPVETPEHNPMQAACLDDGRCLRLADLVFRLLDGPSTDEVVVPGDVMSWVEHWVEHYPGHVRAERRPASALGIRFECDGWDVAYRIGTGYLGVIIDPPVPCLCSCDHGTCSRDATCRGGSEEYLCRHRHPEPRTHYFDHCDKRCPYSTEAVYRWLSVAQHQYGREYSEVRVECKPDLGDDFPAVLRQVLRYPTGGYRCVVIRRHRFTSVTWDQVAAMFEASGITLVHEFALKAEDEP